MFLYFWSAQDHRGEWLHLFAVTIGGRNRCALLCTLNFQCKKTTTKMNNENAFVEMETDHCMIMPCYQWIKHFENSKSHLASSEYLAFLYRKTTKINFVFKPTRFCQKSSPGNLPFCYCVFLLKVVLKSFNVAGLLILKEYSETWWIS